MSITLLGEKFQDTDVKTISGYKSVFSLAIYKRALLEQRKNMYLIDNAINGKSVSGHLDNSNENQSTNADSECDGPLLSPIIDMLTPAIVTSDPPLLSPEPQIMANYVKNKKK
jgi:hypothetical protein